MNAFVNTAAVERVKAGALFLDHHWPMWWMEIDLSTFDITSPCDCVLGQLGCDYAAVDSHFPSALDPKAWPRDGFNLFERFVMPHLGLGYRDMYDLGFEEQASQNVFYPQLQAAWVDAITERRLAASVI